MGGFGHIAAFLSKTREEEDAAYEERKAALQKKRSYEDAKAKAVAAFGEALAQRLYPRARYRKAQFETGVGGTDFELPGGGFVEAKAAAMGKLIRVQEYQIPELQDRRSRVVVGVYNRQLARSSQFHKPESWVLPISRALTLLIDVPGPWLVQALRDHGSYSEKTGHWIKVTTFVQLVSRTKPSCRLLHKPLGMTVFGVRVQRAGLAFYVVGDASPHLDLRPTRARQCAVREEEVPF